MKWACLSSAKVRIRCLGPLKTASFGKSVCEFHPSGQLFIVSSESFSILLKQKASWPSTNVFSSGRSKSHHISGITLSRSKREAHIKQPFPITMDCSFGRSIYNSSPPPITLQLQICVKEAVRCHLQISEVDALQRRKICQLQMGIGLHGVNSDFDCFHSWTVFHREIAPTEFTFRSGETVIPNQHTL